MELDNVIDELTHEIVSEINSKYGERYLAQEYQRLRNNDILALGFTIRRRDSLLGYVPLFYTERYVNDYMNGTSTSTMVKDILGIFEVSLTRNFPSGDILTKNYIQNHLTFELLSYKLNKERLKDLMFVLYLDLAMIFRVIVGKVEDGVSYCLTEAMADRVQMSLADCFSTALLLTPKLLKPKVHCLSAMMAAAMQGSSLSQSFDTVPNLLEQSQEEVPDSMPMCLITNHIRQRGAGVILYRGVLKQIATQYLSNFILLPSSIHEMLIVPWKKEMRLDSLACMIQEINQREVRPEEVLGEKPYVYRRELDRIAMN